MAATRANQFGSGVARVSDGEDFVRAGGFALDQVRDAAGQHRGFAGSRAGNDQHGAMDVLDGEALFGRREEVVTVTRHRRLPRNEEKAKIAL